MPERFPDRHDILFGRAADLDHLLARAQSKGLTGVAGRAQRGKTWLLQQLARGLNAPPRKFLIGYFETHGEGSDVLLRAVSDLYTQWLSDAGYLQQAKLVWGQQQGDLLGRFAASLGGMLDKIGLGNPVAKAVDESLQALVTANQSLRSGGLELKPLQYEQARDLVNLVARVSGRPLALILDGWEKSPALAQQAALLDAILRHSEDWPQLHVFLGLRPEAGAERHVADLQGAYPGRAALYHLLPLVLDEQAERQRLIRYLHQYVPATQSAGDDALIAMIAGHAGVIDRWIKNAAGLRTAEDLRQFAGQAHHYLYREFKQLLPALPDGSAARRLAMRLAVLPTADAAFWNAVKPGLLDELDETLLDTLYQHRLLESVDPPSYGHDKRWEAARRWFHKNWQIGFKREAEQVILAMAAAVREVDEDTRFYATGLANLIIDARAWGLSPLPQILCQCAASLFGQRAAVDADSLLGVAGDADKDIGPLLALGLFNTLNGAKAENDLSRRDALLDALRALAERYPDEAAVRKSLAKGLFNTFNHAKAEDDLARRDALLAELGALAERYADDAAVREKLVGGLVNALNHAKAEGDLSRRDALLNALRSLALRDSDDTAVRKSLSMALFNTLIDAKAEEDLVRRDALLEELRALAECHPNDGVVRQYLAKGLFNTYLQIKAEGDSNRMETLLGELNSLIACYRHDPIIQEITRRLSS